MKPVQAEAEVGYCIVQWKYGRCATGPVGFIVGVMRVGERRWGRLGAW